MPRIYFYRGSINAGRGQCGLGLENWWVGNVVAMSVELIYVCGFVKSGFFFQPNLDRVIPHVVWLALRLN